MARRRPGLSAHAGPNVPQYTYAGRKALEREVAAKAARRAPGADLDEARAYFRRAKACWRRGARDLAMDAVRDACGVLARARG